MAIQVLIVRTLLFLKEDKCDTTSSKCSLDRRVKPKHTLSDNNCRFSKLTLLEREKVFRTFSNNVTISILLYNVLEYFDLSNYSALSKKILFVKWLTQQRAWLSIKIPFSINDGVLAFSGIIHDFFVLLRCSLQITQHFNEDAADWTCSVIFFGLRKTSLVVLSISTTNSASSGQLFVP